MFKFKYIITPVNPEKNIYQLKLTKGSWLKAFAPSLVFFGAAALVGAYNGYQEQKNDELEETPTEK